MLSVNEKAILSHIAQSNGYDALVNLAKDLVFEWSQQIPSKSSEFEYLHESISRDARQEGIREFLKRIEGMRQNDLEFKKVMKKL